MEALKGQCPCPQLPSQSMPRCGEPQLLVQPMVQTPMTFTPGIGTRFCTHAVAAFSMPPSCPQV